MKKSILILVMACFSLLSNAQDKTADVAKKSLPAGYEKIGKDEANLHIKERFHHYRDADMINGINPNHLYRIGDVLIALNSTQTVEKSDPLQVFKRGLDASFQDNTTYKSALRTANGKIILTANYTLGDLGYYEIFVDDSIDTTNHFKALIRYNLSDASKAENVVKHITEHLK